MALPQDKSKAVACETAIVLASVDRRYPAASLARESTAESHENSPQEEKTRILGDRDIHYQRSNSSCAQQLCDAQKFRSEGGVTPGRNDQDHGRTMAPARSEQQGVQRDRQ